MYPLRYVRTKQVEMYMYVHTNTQYCTYICTYIYLHVLHMYVFCMWTQCVHVGLLLKISREERLNTVVCEITPCVCMSVPTEMWCNYYLYLCKYILLKSMYMCMCIYVRTYVYTYNTYIHIHITLTNDTHTNLRTYTNTVCMYICRY